MSPPPSRPSPTRLAAWLWHIVLYYQALIPALALYGMIVTLPPGTLTLETLSYGWPFGCVTFIFIHLRASARSGPTSGSLAALFTLQVPVTLGLRILLSPDASGTELYDYFADLFLANTLAVVIALGIFNLHNFPLTPHYWRKYPNENLLHHLVLLLLYLGTGAGLLFPLTYFYLPYFQLSPRFDTLNLWLWLPLLLSIIIHVYGTVTRHENIFFEEHTHPYFYSETSTHLFTASLITGTLAWFLLPTFAFVINAPP